MTIPLYMLLVITHIPKLCRIYIMNDHIYSTLFKTQERESDRRSKEIEQRKESQKKNTNKTTRTWDPKY